MEYDVINEKDGSGKLPNQKELEKELSDYLSKKYGNRIKIISPFLFPKGQAAQTEEGGAGKRGEESPSFDLLPEELEAHLDSFVVKQDRAKAVLATKICTHFNRVKQAEESPGSDEMVLGKIKKTTSSEGGLDLNMGGDSSNLDEAFERF